jgi:hypothetical protein
MLPAGGIFAFIFIVERAEEKTTMLYKTSIYDDFLIEVCLWRFQIE